MPTFAYALLILGLFGIAWRSHLPRQGRPAVAPKTPRLLKPRTPLDCPACCPPASDPTLPAPVRASVRPWREIKSRRGAPKRVITEGFACPNSACQYDGITDAQIHAASGRWEAWAAERIQMFRCQACRTTFSARIHTPLSRLKTPSYQVALVRK